MSKKPRKRKNSEEIRLLLSDQDIENNDHSNEKSQPKRNKTKQKPVAGAGPQPSIKDSTAGPQPSIKDFIAPDDI